MLRYPGIAIFLIVLLMPDHGWSQDAGSGAEADSTITAGIVVEGNGAVKEIESDSLRDRPDKAAYLSAALPGLGQMYNQKYWKLPILYGGGVVLGYFLNYNHRLYVQYRNSLIALRDQDNRTQPHDPRFDETDYERATDYWRRNRDLLIIGIIVVYALNIVDAHVDAHLNAFTVEDEISMRLVPSVSTIAMNTNVYGVSLIINLP
jgi:hypothetical protein